MEEQKAALIDAMNRIADARILISRFETIRQGLVAQAENMEQVYGVIKNSWYKCQDIERLMEHGLGNGAKELTDKIYELTSRKEPYSAAVLNSYLYFKEREIEQIITTIEQIRYGMTARI